MQVQSYLMFNGRCEEALEFYKKAIGAKVEMMMRFKDAPEGQCAPGSENNIMHSSFKVGDTVLMASDGMNSGPTRVQRHLTDAQSQDRSRVRASVQRAGRGRPGVPAADQDVFLAEVRRGHGQVRRELDGSGRATDGQGGLTVPSKKDERQ